MSNTIDELIRQQFDEGITDLDKVADLALTKILADPGDAHAAFYPSIRQRVATLARVINHGRERDAASETSAGTEGSNSTHDQSHTSDASIPVEPYLNPAMACRPVTGFDLDALCQIPIGKGKFEQVAWGDVTIEQHQARITYLATKRDGISDTIALHERAITACEEADVDTLRAVEERSKASAA